MRVIAGQWRGRTLLAPPGSATRPTADRVRESLFSMLASRLGSFEGLAVADLYAGSGALGIEALSRGAASCHFVESDRAAASTLRANLAALGAGDRATTVNCRVENFAPTQSFHLIFADPPYASGATPAALAADWLEPGGWAAIETARGAIQETTALSIIAERDIARARLTLFRRD
ncbi:16S rRNA (guanine(966)-N(2))-methyltransferase RsmD [Sphingomonas mesophila]|uniref:16S rRNA (guanine(966)-N(2))-methyltransferase RsmD n=1 Tax=Sphingomonas mesophila TaxID=2303576 RepID=UPI000E582683|nr:16S rRNA (guanine(966)-N(2))-methyltransferase RsmD [Sphingomonas mesophila]